MQILPMAEAQPGKTTWKIWALVPDSRKNKSAP